MRDDANERDILLNHAHSEPSEASERAEMPAELVGTHEALTQLAAAWSATTPSAGRLATFTRQLPAQQSVATAPDAAPTLRERPRPRSDARVGYPHRGAGRLLVGLVAAVVIVGLLAATLLKLAPSRTGRSAQTTPTAVATAPVHTARSAEEPSQLPPDGAWSTAAQTQLIPAPSDGRVVYQTRGAVARVSEDGGATWRALTLPAFTHTHVVSENVGLVVSDADPHLVLLTIKLALDSPNPADCPAGSTTALAAPMHGGILASGDVICNASFASRDEGGSWTPTHGLYTAFGQPTVWQVGDTLYGVRDDVDRSPQITFPLVGFRLMASHDQGVSWGYADTTLKQPSRYICSILPSSVDGTLYAITFTSPCYSGAIGAHTVWRSMDDGATWRQLSTLDALTTVLAASSLSADGHGIWLYLLTWDTRTSAPRALVSLDNGVSWSQAPQAPRAGSATTIRPVNSALSDGSVVVALVTQAGVEGQTLGKATFYAWRPGDSAWRPLTPPLQANYDNYFFGATQIVIAHGGQNAIDTLSVMDRSTLSSAGPDTTHTYLIR